MRMIGSRLAISASLLSVSVALSTPAWSQAADAQEADDQNYADEIIVTGSLIRRPNNTAVSPIVTVGTETIKESGNVNLNDALNQFPSFTTSGNAATGGQGTGGRATINLHGLGSNRNLVLLDGKRLPLSDISGNVDTNIIPESIIGGIDVITGGASAVYGSDAMSGVVNFKTLQGFEGVKVDSQYNISERGDGAKFNTSLAFGSKFAQGRGSVLAAFSYTKQDPIQGSEREFFHDKVPSSFLGYGTFIPSATNAPDAGVVNAIFSGYGVTGTINPLDRLGYNDNGTLFVQNGGQNYLGPTDGNGYAVFGGNVRMPVGQQLQVLNSLKRKTAFVKADYEVTPDITAYGQFLYVDLTVNTASGGSLTQFPTLTSIPVTNPFIPTDLATILASRPDATAPIAWNGRYVGVPYKNWDENFIVQQYMAGLRGGIVDGWSFDVYASYDESKHNQTMHNAVLKSRVQTLLNAADGGASICEGGFNPFGDANARSLSAECQAYITKDARSVENLTQTQVQGQLNGSLFDLGAGPAQIALVANYRRNTYSFSPDSDLTALSGFAPGGNIEGVVNTQPLAKTGISVKEIAAQVDIPLISDKPFVRELAIGAAGRISDYSSTGSVKSYEFDARWRPIESLLIRGGFQRAVRAPNIGELYSPQQGAQLVIGTPPGGLGDPCDVRSTARTGSSGAQVSDLCVALGVPAAAIGSYQFPTTATGQATSGNLDLTPESANTFNVGAVFNSPAVGGIFGDFSVSVDYYNIKIKNVISPVPGLTVLSKCFNLDGSNPGYSASNEYCQLVSRDNSGQILQISTPYLNLGALKTDGVEAQIHWGVPAGFLAESGKLYVDSAIGWLHNYKVQLLPGAPFLDYTGISNGGAGPNSVPPRATPKWKALTTFGYKSDVLGVGLRWRYQGSLKDTSYVLTPNNVQVGVKSYNLWDMFANVKVNNRLEFRAGVNNLFDKGLPYVASSQISTDPALYDLVGRSFYMGARVTF
ncbi:TonB-dependent receptor domain-containing protein [Novosphingobium pentaromativorans]|nr:TonB-dependent receptor [Novosphingobium pentaromativorans]